MKLLGMVTEVRATELAVSLPHGLVGRYVWCLVSSRSDYSLGAHVFVPSRPDYAGCCWRIYLG